MSSGYALFAKIKSIFKERGTFVLELLPVHLKIFGPSRRKSIKLYENFIGVERVETDIHTCRISNHV